MPVSKQTKHDEIRAAPHLVALSNDGSAAMRSVSIPIPSSVPATSGVTISNTLGGGLTNAAIMAPDVYIPGEEEQEVPGITCSSTDIIPPTVQPASPRLLKDAIRRGDSIKTPMGKPISTSTLPPTQITAGLVDKQGRDVRTIREDPVTGVTLMPGVVVVEYVRVTDIDPTNPNKGIVPVLSRALKANF